MKTDRFVKVMLVIIAGLLFLNCGKDGSAVASKQLPQKVIDAAIDHAKEGCKRDKLECKDFKVDSEPRQMEVTDADKANGISEKGIVGFNYIYPYQGKWKDGIGLFYYAIYNNGDLKI